MPLNPTRGIVFLFKHTKRPETIMLRTLDSLLYGWIGNFVVHVGKWKGVVLRVLCLVRQPTVIIGFIVRWMQSEVGRPREDTIQFVEFTAKVLHLLFEIMLRMDKGREFSTKSQQHVEVYSIPQHVVATWWKIHALCPS